MTDGLVRHPLDRQKVATGGRSEALVVAWRSGLSFSHVMARKGQDQAVANALGIGATPGVATCSEDFTALPLAPRQWLLMGADGRDGAFTTDIAERVAGIGYASEQSHGRVAIRVNGPRAPELLARECRLDLHEQHAPTGFVAQTTMADVGVLIHRVDDAPTYDLILYPGYAVHFWQWLEHAGLPLGARFIQEHSQ